MRRATPYNIDDIFKSDSQVSTQEKKQFCVLLDLIRSLIVRSKIQAIQHEIVVFGDTYRAFDKEIFFECLASQINNQSDYLNFIYRKMGDVSKLKENLNYLDEDKLTALYESKK